MVGAISDVKDCHIEPITISDHGLVVMSIHLETEKQPKQWRMNVSLLNYPEIIQSIKKDWNKYGEHNDNGEVSVSILWEAAKAVLGGKLIALSSKIKKDYYKEQGKLEKLIQELELEYKKKNDKNILKSLNQYRQKFNKLLTHKAEGALRFANQKYHESGNGVRTAYNCIRHTQIVRWQK